MKQKLLILLFFYTLCTGSKAQNQDEKELTKFFSYVIDSLISGYNSSNDTILIKSKTNESLYKYCDDLSLEKFINATFGESDQTEILNGLRNSQVISLYDIIPEKEKVTLIDSVPNNYLQIKVLETANLICNFSTPVFISGNRCIFAYDISGMSGGLTLFKKQKNQWSIDKHFCEWYE